MAEQQNGEEHVDGGEGAGADTPVTDAPATEAGVDDGDDAGGAGAEEAGVTGDEGDAEALTGDEDDADAATAGDTVEGEPDVERPSAEDA